MVSETVTIINKLGLHARAASKFIACTSAFSAEVELETVDKTADGKSIMSVMMLAASRGTELTIRCTGSDEEAALAAIKDLIARRFDEGE